MSAGKSRGPGAPHPGPKGSDRQIHLYGTNRLSQSSTLKVTLLSPRRPAQAHVLPPVYHPPLAPSGFGPWPSWKCRLKQLELQAQELTRLLHYTPF